MGRLARGAYEAKLARGLRYLRGARQQAADVARDGVEDDVQPAADRVVG